MTFELAYKNDLEAVYDVVQRTIKEIYPKGVKTILATELDKYFDYDYVMNKFNKYITNHKINYEDL